MALAPVAVRPRDPRGWRSRGVARSPVSLDVAPPAPVASEEDATGPAICIVRRRAGSEDSTSPSTSSWSAPWRWSLL